MNWNLPRTALAVLGVLLCLVPAAPDGAAAQDVPIWEEVAAQRRAAADSVLAGGPEIREPVFAFLTGLACGDSLGHWSGEDLRLFAEQQDISSRFPLGLVTEVVRRRPQEGEPRSWAELPVRAVWELTLTGDLDRAMPYSILGYHPGSLLISRKLLLTEVDGGALTVRGTDGTFILDKVIMLRLDRGHVILDVDGIVDRLLGKALDDAATVGFVLAREEGRLLGLAVSLGRDGRSIYGEFDFRRDRILPHGRPLASALSAASRRCMLAGYMGPALGAWVDE